jgi:sugar (pentulose or hexulose) kinase
MVNLDAAGKPLRPIILFVDQRKAECKKPLPPLPRALLKLVGMGEIVQIQRRVTNSNWIKEQEPEIWEKTDKYVMISGYLTYMLTGIMKDSTASQIGHIPIDNRKNVWMKKSALLYSVFDIPRSKLADLVEPGAVIGKITLKASEETGIPEGIPVIAAGSDKGCETVGTGCIDRESASLSFGTLASVQLYTEKYVEPLPFMPCYPALIKGSFNPEIQIYRGFWMLTWFVKEFAAKERAEAETTGEPPEEILNRKMQAVPPGSDGLMLQPYWTPGLTSPEGKGAIIGFSDVHTRIHLYRAILEGLNYGLLDGLRIMEKRSGNKVKSLTVSGGGAQSDIVCQLTADMFGVPVYRVQTYETSGLGAAMVALMGIGRYKDMREAGKAMVRRCEPFVPDTESNKIYESLYNDVYKKLYSRLKPSYTAIRSIMGDSVK